MLGSHNALIPPNRPSERGELQPLLLTPTQAAETLAVSRTTLYELMSAGTLAFVRIGRARRVPMSVLQQFVDRELQRQGFCL